MGASSQASTNEFMRNAASGSSYLSDIKLNQIVKIYTTLDDVGFEDTMMEPYNTFFAEDAQKSNK